MKDQRLEEKPVDILMSYYLLGLYILNNFHVFLETFFSFAFYDAKFQMTQKFLHKRDRIGVLPFDLLAM